MITRYNYKDYERAVANNYGHASKLNKLMHEASEMGCRRGRRAVVESCIFEAVKSAVLLKDISELAHFELTPLEMKAAKHVYHTIIEMVWTKEQLQSFFDQPMRRAIYEKDMEELADDNDN